MNIMDENHACLNGSWIDGSCYMGISTKMLCVIKRWIVGAELFGTELL